MSPLATHSTLGVGVHLEVSIEMEIQRQLDHDPSSRSTAEYCEEMIRADSTSDTDRFQYWHFLFHAGFYKKLLKTMIERLQNKHRIHWGLFIETLALHSAQPSGSTIEALFKGIRRQSGVEDLWAADGWDKWSERFERLRAGLSEEKLRMGAERKDALIEKFHFLKNQRVTEQAGRTLRQLIFLYPEDLHLVELKNAFDEERAREILSNRFAENPGEPEIAPLPKDQVALLKVWVKDILAKIKKNPKAGYDLAMMLILIDQPEFAMKVLEKAPTGVGADWLMAESLLKLHRYVDLLEHLNQLEAKYSSDTETAFAIAYLRAQALKASGESAAAVEILRNIVQVRPNYRSAQRMISEWSTGYSNHDMTPYPTAKDEG